MPALGHRAGVRLQGSRAPLGVKLGLRSGLAPPPVRVRRIPTTRVMTVCYAHVVAFRSRRRVGIYENEGAVMVTDPVCNMKFEPSEAVETVEHEGTTYYFCSQDCAESFREEPEDYI